MQDGDVRRIVRRVVPALALAMACTTSNAAALLGEASFQGYRDLNLVQTDDGATLEFLDFFPTRNLTLDVALATYEPYGFHLASASEVTQLFKAFGFTYAFTPGTFTAMTDMSAAERDSFIEVMTWTYLTGQPLVLAMYANVDSWVGQPYFCIGACSPAAFTNDVYIDHIIGSGSTLVRESIVPIPPAVWLFGSALGLMGVMRRKISFMEEGGQRLGTPSK